MNDIHPIKPPIELAVFSETMINIALFFLLFLVLVTFLLVFLYFRKKTENSKNKILEPEEVNTKVDHYQVAKDRLADIKKYIDKEDFKIFQLKISNIIRSYLSGISQENFSEMTSMEILQNKKMNSDLKKTLEEFLTISDREKFAKAKHKKKHAEKVYTLALLIIEKK